MCDVTAEILCFENGKVLFSNIYITINDIEIGIVGNDRILQEECILSEKDKERLHAIVDEYQKKIENAWRKMIKEINETFNYKEVQICL